MADHADGLRDELMRRLLSEVERCGPGFDKRALVQEFIGRGVPKATAYRWVDKAMKTGRPGQAAIRAVKASNASTAAPRPSEAPELGPEALEGEVLTAEMAEMRERSLAAVASLDDVTGHETVPVINHIRQCLEIADKVIQFATDPDTGKPRNTKLLLMASEHKRRAADTAAKLTQLMIEIGRADAFNRAVVALLERVIRTHPEVGREALRELDTLAARWGSAGV